MGKLNIGKALKGVLGVVAPTLGMALGGPLGGFAGKWLGDKLGVKPEDLPTFIGAQDPETMIKLKQLDQDFQLELEAMDVDIFALEVEDRKSARDMAKTNMVPQITLSVIFIIGYFGLVFSIFSGMVELVDTMRQTGNILLGVMTANLPLIMQFWFGSSHGSKRKSELMSK